MYHGDIRLGDILDFKFTTVNTSGVPTSLLGTPVISAYENNDVTEITAGVVLTVDFDARTGLNHVRVTASGANGFQTAANYDLVITTGTVDGGSVVGYVVGSFSIENRSAIMSTTVANKTLDITATGEAGLDWANIGAPTTVQGLSGTTIKTATDVETDTQDIQARLPAVLTGDGNIKSDTLRISGTLQTAGDIIGDTNDIQSRLPAALDTGRIRAVAEVVGDKTGYAIGVGGITSTSFAAAALDAAAIAVDAIGALEFAQGAADKVWLTTARTLTSGVVKKNAIFNNLEFLMVDSTDHVTPKTGLTVTGTRSIDGGAFAAVTGAIAEVGNGIYQFDAAAADTNGDTVTFRFIAATADDTFVTIITST